MLKVFYGSDRKASIDAAMAAATQAADEYTTIDDKSFIPNMFEDLTASSSLFGGVQSYVVDTPSTNTEFQDATLAALEDMASSTNHFFIVEGTLLAAAKKKLGKHAESIEEFVADKPDRFNTFGLADALARRDKKSLWVMIQEARLLGIREEEMIGILWWQLKSLKLAAVTNSAAEAGMKDYPYRKAKQGLQKYSPDEVGKLSQSLISLYHQGHKGVKDISLALEEWVLKM